MIEHRPGAELEFARQILGELLDQADRARHGHGQFECTNAAFEQRVDDGAQLIGLLHSDHGDDAAALNLSQYLKTTHNFSPLIH